MKAEQPHAEQHKRTVAERNQTVMAEMMEADQAHPVVAEHKAEREEADQHKRTAAERDHTVKAEGHTAVAEHEAE